MRELWMRSRSLLLLILCAACAGNPPARPAPGPPAVEQTSPSTAVERPLPMPVEVPTVFQNAIEAGTRTVSGAPGTRYWVQFADYRLNARFLPDSKRLEGSAVIAYRNNS